MRPASDFYLAGDGENDPVLPEFACCFFVPVIALEMLKARKTRLITDDAGLCHRKFS
jgi:hypothetical protein